MPALAARYSTAPTKSTCSISWTNVNTSPRLVAAEAAVAAGLLADVERRRPLGVERAQPDPVAPDALAAATCCPTTSTIDTVERMPLDVLVDDRHAAESNPGGRGRASAPSALGRRRRCLVCSNAVAGSSASACDRSSLSEKPTDAISTTAITTSESHVGMWYQLAMIILTPTKARMTPDPAAGTLNRLCMSASRKYSERSPRIANAFEANTMNCSWLTASTAGTESTAKSTSVASTSSSTANSGVASRWPFALREQLLPVELVGASARPG